MKKIKEYQKLNLSIYFDLRKAFNASPIFSNFEKYKDKYNLCCAVMDRIETAVKYLNSHMEYPFSEESDLVTFVVYSCMVVDGVKTLYERIFHESAYNEEKKYFIHAQQQWSLNLSEDEYVDDDRFFEYFRAIVFAHPYNTDRTYKKIYGSQVSPYVLCGYTPVNIIGDISDPIGAKIYTSKERKNGGDVILLEVSFKQLINYLNDRYRKLINVVDWLKEEKIETEEKWKKEMVFPRKGPVETLCYISQVLDERLMTNYGVRQLYYYLTCKITNPKNEIGIRIFREKIIDSLPALIDAVNMLDEERIDEIVYELTRSPDNVKGENYYQLEKIYMYLHESNEVLRSEESSNEEWGLMQANAFSKGFASKWVSINAFEMPTSEIKLLVAVACYLENHKKEYSNFKKISLIPISK